MFYPHLQRRMKLVCRSLRNFMAILEARDLARRSVRKLIKSNVAGLVTDYCDRVRNTA
jgi:hypothetical protein